MRYEIRKDGTGEVVMSGEVQGGWDNATAAIAAAKLAGVLVSGPWQRYQTPDGHPLSLRFPDDGTWPRYRD